MEDVRFRKILLAVDGSDASRRAGEVAGGLAQANAGDVLIVHSHRHIADFIGEPYYQRLFDRLQNRTRDLLAPFRRTIQSTEPVLAAPLNLHAQPVALVPLRDPTWQVALRIMRALLTLLLMTALTPWGRSS